jgi:hypothetical protein
MKCSPIWKCGEYSTPLLWFRSHIKLQVLCTDLHSDPDIMCNKMNPVDAPISKIDSEYILALWAVAWKVNTDQCEGSGRTATTAFKM